MTSLLKTLVPAPYRAALRRRLTPGRAPLHGHFAIAVTPRVGYCYIRKNACSAFTRLIVEHSTRPKPKSERAFDFLARNHQLTWGDLPGCAHMVFVIRDPLERLVSGYVQQVVKRLAGPYDELEASLQAVAGRGRAELSFEDFVTRYLATEDFARINVHFVPQIAHLAPLPYTAVLLDRSLVADARHVFGAALAERYFARPINATASLPPAPDPDAARRPAAEHFRRMAADGAQPDRNDLLTLALRERLSHIYRDDLALLARYRSLRAADPDRPPALDMREHDFASHYVITPQALRSAPAAAGARR